MDPGQSSSPVTESRNREPRMPGTMITGGTVIPSVREVYSRGRSGRLEPTQPATRHTSPRHRNTAPRLGFRTECSLPGVDGWTAVQSLADLQPGSALAMVSLHEKASPQAY